MTHHTMTPIDAHRPWIRDERDDPARMDWFQTLFNPMGMTGKLHFSRAWTFMFMGRVLLFIVPVFVAFIAGLAGADMSGAWQPVKSVGIPLPALLLPFFFFTIITEFTSWVAHVRRFAEANRSTLKAAIVLVPLFLGLLGFAGGVVSGSAQYQAQAGKGGSGRDCRRRGRGGGRDRCCGTAGSAWPAPSGWTATDRDADGNGRRHGPGHAALGALVLFRHVVDLAACCAPAEWWRWPVSHRQ